MQVQDQKDSVAGQFFSLQNYFWKLEHWRGVHGRFRGNKTTWRAGRGIPALADIVGDQQAREAYLQMAEAYLILAGNVGREKQWLMPSNSAKTKTRERLKQTTSLKDRLASFAHEMREKAFRLS